MARGGRLGWGSLVVATALAGRVVDQTATLTLTPAQVLPAKLEVLG